MKSIVRVTLASLALIGLAGPGPERAVAAPPAPAPSESPSPPPAAVPGKDPLLEFVPRERVPADSVVAFPVDI